MGVAWGDESEIRHDHDVVYILAAVVVRESEQQPTRAAMRALLLPGERKVHWYQRSARARDQAIRVVSTLNWTGVLAARVCEDAERPERRRRKCFEDFAAALDARGVTDLVMESRGRRDDHQDRQLIDALRARRMLRGLRISHLPGTAEPLLWLADCLCGMQAAAIRGDRRCLAALDDRGLGAVQARTAQTPGPTIRRELPGFTS